MRPTDVGVGPVKTPGDIDDHDGAVIGATNRLGYTYCVDCATEPELEDHPLRRLNVGHSDHCDRCERVL